ncbi:SpaA isopeptide-forming pilin-related protein [Eubacteriales bacterium KG125]
MKKINRLLSFILAIVIAMGGLPLNMVQAQEETYYGNDTDGRETFEQDIKVGRNPNNLDIPVFCMDENKSAPGPNAEDWQYKKITGSSDNEVKQYTRLGNRRQYDLQESYMNDLYSPFEGSLQSKLGKIIYYLQNESPYKDYPQNKKNAINWVAVGENLGDRKDIFTTKDEPINIIKEILAKEDGYTYNMVLFIPTKTDDTSSVDKAQPLATAERVKKEEPESSEKQEPTPDTYKTSVSILKVDEDGKPLEGAKLKVTDQEGKEVVSEWTSTKNAKVVQLDQGKYKLVEVEAPEGYKKAEAKEFTVSAQEVNTEPDNNEYTAWTNPNKYSGANEIKNPIYISIKDDEDNNVVAYCFNLKKSFPNGKSEDLTNYKNTVYKKLNYNDDLYSKISEGKVIDDINEAIMKVVWNGYSGDGKEKSIQKKYNLTEGQFREITQTAIWKFTDNGNDDRTWTDQMKKAYNELVNYKELPNHPKNMVLNIFKPYKNDGSEDNTYQNLLSAKFVPAKTLEVKLTNTKEEISKGQIKVTKKWEGDILKEGESHPDVYFQLLKNNVVQGQPRKYEENEIVFEVDGNIEDYTVKEVDEYGNDWNSKGYTTNEPVYGKVTSSTIKEKSDNTDSQIKYERSVEFTNTKLTKVNFSKKALTEDGEELAGAKIKLTKKDGTVVKEWVTDGKLREFELEEGSYTFTEVSAPDKYQVATAINFEIKDGKVLVTGTEVKGNTIVMVDKLKEVPKTKVNFSKKALTEDGEELAGAKIKLTKKDGTVVKEWVTDGKLREFELEEGSYTFTEVSAPDKYQVATAINFEIKDGKALVTGTEVKGNTIVMVDKLKEVPKTKVNFSKKALTEDGEELAGAKIKLTKKDGTVVKEWVTDGSVKEFELKDGKYTFTEVSAPDKYQVATAINFEIKDGKALVTGTEVKGNTIVMVDKLKEVPKTKVNFSKKALTEDGEELAGAKIKLTKKDGTVVKEWVTDGKLREFELEEGSYTFTEVSAPDKYQVATAINFEIKDGKVLVTGTEVKGNTIVMVDKLKEVPPTEPKKPGTLPKTGDGFNPSVYAGIMALAGGALTLLAIKKRKEDEDK